MYEHYDQTIVCTRPFQQLPNKEAIESKGWLCKNIGQHRIIRSLHGHRA